MIGIIPVILIIDGENETKHNTQTIILSFDFKGIGGYVCVWGE